MIHPALDYICKELSSYLNETGKVELKNLVKQDGSVDPELNKILCLLINVEEEKIANRKAFKYVKGPSSEDESRLIYGKRNPDLNLNLYILFVNHFEHYTESLKYLTRIVSFFQEKNVFVTDLDTNNGSTGSTLTRLVFELYTPNFEQINQLWGAIGAKYAPSLMYKLKMITVTSDVNLDEARIIDKIDVATENLTKYH